jgi:ubiquinone/menaquinone biosynthesis C-methylase UbiE
MTNAEARQLDYYRETARQYDEWHTAAFDEHYFALEHMLFYLRWIGATSVLDTGCGTGRSMRFILERIPDISVRGNDPSKELLQTAAEQHGISPNLLDCASTLELPYPDDAFDAVIETGVLHHIPDPSRAVAEMLRVARKAVFLSDSNIYGQGSLLARIVKLGLARIHLLKYVNRLRRGGDWYYSVGDGVAYSYSVFDSYGAVEADCAEVIVVPTARKPGSAQFPLFASPHCLLCGFKEPLPATATTENSGGCCSRRAAQ